MTLVAVGSEDVLAVSVLDDLSDGPLARLLSVEEARVGLQVHPLASHAVVLRVVPAAESFPDMVVGPVPVLVVGRIQVEQVTRQVVGRLDRVREVCRASLAWAVLDELGNPHLKIVERPRRPRLQVRHLLTHGGVHTVCRLHERSEKSHLQEVVVDQIDLPSNGLNLHAVLLLEEPGLSAERVDEVPVHAIHGLEPLDLLRDSLRHRGIAAHVCFRNDVGVRRVVNGSYVVAGLLRSQGDVTGSREEVDDVSDAIETFDDGHDVHDESPFAAEVLDQGIALTTVRSHASSTKSR